MDQDSILKSENVPEIDSIGDSNSKKNHGKMKIHMRKSILHKIEKFPASQSFQDLDPSLIFDSSGPDKIVKKDESEKKKSERLQSAGFSRLRKIPRSQSVNFLSDVPEIFPVKTYKKRLSIARKEMKTALEEFIRSFSSEYIASKISNPVERIATENVRHLCADVIEKCDDVKEISSAYFATLVDNLNEILDKAKEKATSHLTQLRFIIHAFIIIIFQFSRILECLEINSDEMSRMVNEEYIKIKNSGSTPSLVEYINSKVKNRKSGELEPSPSNPQDNPENLESGTKTVHESNFGLLKGRTLRKLKSLLISDNLTSKSNSNLHTENVPQEEDFEIIKLISQGAYGAVYLAKHKISKKKHAVKKISKAHALLKNQVTQIFFERDIMSITENPFIVSLICSYETKTHLCLVMEFVEGADCASLLKSFGTFPYNLAKFYIAETVLAIEYIHSIGIIHRDVKPDNLLITSLGHIKLTDFGLSKVGLMKLTSGCHGKKFEDSEVYGTPDYIAPEVILLKAYSFEVDWWSIGIAFYEFLFGIPPFYGESPQELFDDVVQGEVYWPDEPQIKSSAKNFIQHLLKKNPLQRLGHNGSEEVKTHPIFNDMDWTELLLRKTEFIPSLQNEDDTSFFDTRSDRFNHEDSKYEMMSIDEIDHNFSEFPSFSFCNPKFTSVISNSLGDSSSIIDTGYESNESSMDSALPNIATSSPLNVLNRPIPPESRIQNIVGAKKSTSNQTSYVKNLITRFENLKSSDEFNSRHNSPLIISPISEEFSQNKISTDYDLVEGVQVKPTSSSLSPIKHVDFKKKPGEGFPFTLKGIRVYSNDSKRYTIHHMVQTVESKDLIIKRNLLPGLLVTHINNVPIDGFQHVQVLRLIFLSGDSIKLTVANFRESGIEVRSVHKVKAAAADINETQISPRPIWRRIVETASDESQSMMYWSSSPSSFGESPSCSPTIPKPRPQVSKLTKQYMSPNNFLGDQEANLSSGNQRFSYQRSNTSSATNMSLPKHISRCQSLQNYQSHESFNNISDKKLSEDFPLKNKAWVRNENAPDIRYSLVEFGTNPSALTQKNVNKNVSTSATTISSPINQKTLCERLMSPPLSMVSTRSSSCRVKSLVSMFNAKSADSSPTNHSSFSFKCRKIDQSEK